MESWARQFEGIGEKVYGLESEEESSIELVTYIHIREARIFHNAGKPHASKQEVLVERPVIQDRRILGW
jgi:hypothetical protein